MRPLLLPTTDRRLLYGFSAAKTSSTDHIQEAALNSDHYRLGPLHLPIHTERQLTGLLFRTIIYECICLSLEYSCRGCLEEGRAVLTE